MAFVEAWTKSKCCTKIKPGPVGTPTDETWPGVTSLPDFNVSFPLWPAKVLIEELPELKSVGSEGVDLLERLLVFCPKKRISARQALRHSYFTDAQQQH